MIDQFKALLFYLIYMKLHSIQFKVQLLQPSIVYIVIDLWKYYLHEQIQDFI